MKTRKTKKNGISLVILAITIAVMAILAGATIITTSTLITNAKKTAFSQDLTEIENAVKSYYASNNSFPIVEDSEFNKEELLQIANLNSSSAALEEEFTLNKEVANPIFYEIDLSKINVESTKRGTKTGNNVNDIYVINESGTTVYYPLGQKIGPKTYFSISSKLVKIKRVSVEDLSKDNSSITISTRPVIGAIKNTEIYTNNLKINISTIIGESETLGYKIGTELNYTEIDSSPHTLELSDATLSESQKADIIAGNKTITIGRTGNGYQDTKVISISNLDIQKPTVSATAEYNAYETFNTITLVDLVDLGGSGIKEARYEYLTKVDTQGVETQYYSTPPIINSEYLKSVGKKSNIEIIKLAKNIKSIGLVIVDSAGNASNVYTYTFTDLSMLEGV